MQTEPTQSTKAIYIYICMHHTRQFPPHPVPAPGVNVTRATSSKVEFVTTAHGSATRVIAGCEVTRFGVPMIGQYVNTGRGRRVPINTVVPGAQYRIIAWALGDGRSATPAVVDATTIQAGQCILYLILKPSIAHTCRCTDFSNRCHKFVACSCFPLLDNRENSIGLR